MGNKNGGRRYKPIVGKPKPIRAQQPDGGTRLLKRAKKVFPQRFAD